MATTGPDPTIEAMVKEFIPGVRAICSDGFCGQVVGTILDPASGTVTHLVISPRHCRADGRLVPVELIEAGADEIRLRCSIAEFEQLDSAGEIELADGGDHGGDHGGGHGPGAVMGHGNVGTPEVGASGSGTAIGMGLGHITPGVTSDNVPEAEGGVVRQRRVHAVDGVIGQLKGFAVDPAGHQVTHVLLREGHLWGRKEVAIPVSAVSSVENGIRLNLTRKQVAELPPRD